jgi:hypothetical protein
MMDEDQLGEYIEQHFTHTLFRLETHDYLDVGTDWDDYERYCAGLPGPNMDRKGPWMEVIRGEVAEGRYTYRVHVVRSPLTQYLRYAMEWGYAYNAQAGERIGIIDVAEQDCPAQIVFQDYWLIDGEHVALMHYDGAGRYVGATIPEPGELGRYRAAADAAWAAAEPFQEYWSRHRHEWRDQQVA